MSHGQGQTRSQSRRTLVGLMIVITAILVIAALRESYFVTMPLFFAFFVALLLRPVQHAINNRLPERLHVLGLAASMGIFIAVLAALGAGVWLTVDVTTGRITKYVDQLRGYWETARQWAGVRGFDLEGATSGNVQGQVIDWAMAGVTNVWQWAFILVLIFFLVMLMLIYAHEWGQKVDDALTSDRARRVRATVNDVATKLRQFLLMRTIVSVISGVTAGLWLWAVGVDFAILWGLLTFLLNYIPNIGSTISVILPTLLALVQFDIWWALLALGGLLAIEQIIGYYLDPRLMGRALALSPVVLLMSVIFWGWLWGVAGAILAVPMTGSIYIVCSHVDALKPVAELLGHDPG